MTKKTGNAPRQEMPKKTLTTPQQEIVTRCLARFIPPQEVAEFVKEQFGVEITRQAVEGYDPTKVAGWALKAELKVIFERERAAYVADVQAVPIANKVERLKRLERLADKAERRDSLVISAQLIRQAKEEADSIAAVRSVPPEGGARKPDHELTDAERADLLLKVLNAGTKSGAGQAAD